MKRKSEEKQRSLKKILAWLNILHREKIIICERNSAEICLLHQKSESLTNLNEIEES